MFSLPVFAEVGPPALHLAERNEGGEDGLHTAQPQGHRQLVHDRLVHIHLLGHPQNPGGSEHVVPPGPPVRPVPHSFVLPQLLIKEPSTDV